MRLLPVLVATSLLVPAQLFAAPPTTVGRILLDVEQSGEAWYVDPVAEERFYLRNGNAAYQALRNFGLGITNTDLAKIPVGFEDRFDEVDSDNDGIADKLEEGLGTNPNNRDSDGDGFSDREEVAAGYNPNGPGALSVDSTLVNKLRGRILLQVEERGQAWYVHPVDGRRYYMSDGEAAYQIMRYLSLGITSQNLATIPLRSRQVDCADSRDCFIGMVQTGVSAKVRMFDEFTFIVNQKVRSTAEYIPGEDGEFTIVTNISERTITYTDSQRQKLKDEEGLNDVQIAERERKNSLAPNMFEVSTCVYQSDELEHVLDNIKFFNDEEEILRIDTRVGQCDFELLNK